MKDSWLHVWWGHCDWNGKDDLGSAKCKQWVPSCGDYPLCRAGMDPGAGAWLGEPPFPVPPLLTACFFLCHDLQWGRVLLESVLLFSVIVLRDRVKIQPVPPETHSSKGRIKAKQTHVEESCGGFCCCDHFSCWLWEDCCGHCSWNFLSGMQCTKPSSLLK